jgi:hypothetical protein
MRREGLSGWSSPALMSDDQLRAEDCRFAILRALAARAEGAHTAEAIRTVYMRYHDYSAQEVGQALALLATGGLVLQVVDDTGLRGGVRWQITLKGNVATTL